MPFDNDDLKLLKEDAEWAPLHGITHPLWPKIRALLSRLEAAEAVCRAQDAYGFAPETEAIQDAMEAWRQAAGND